MQAVQARVEASVAIPFCTERADAVSPDGRFIAVAVDSFPISGRRVVSLQLLRESGGAVYQVAWEYPPRPIPGGGAAAVRELARRIAAMQELGIAMQPVATPEFLTMYASGQDGVGLYRFALPALQ